MISQVLKETVLGLVGLVEDAAAHVGADGDQTEVVEEREGLDLEPVKVLHDLHTDKDGGEVGNDDQDDVEGVHQGQLGSEGRLNSGQEGAVVVNERREELLHLGSQGILKGVDIGGSTDTESGGKINKQILRQLVGDELRNRLHGETTFFLLDFGRGRRRGERRRSEEGKRKRKEKGKREKERKEEKIEKKQSRGPVPLCLNR